MFVEHSTQEFRVLLVVSTADLANTVERAESTGVSLSSEHHHLVRIDMHCNVLQERDTRNWLDQSELLLLSFSCHAEKQMM